MQLTCVNKPTKFKNLTLNKDYQAVEDGETYAVTNDIGFTARYAKKYFRVVPEVPATRNLIDLLRVSYDEENGSVTVILNRTTRTVGLDNSQSVVSCGINEIDGISNLKRIVNEMYAAKANDIIGTKTEMFSAVMGTLMEGLRNEEGKMCWLFSDQVRESDTELDEYLTSISDATTTGVNPNTHNQIILWVIQ